MPSNKLYSIKQVWNTGGITPHILNLGIGQTEPVKITPLLLYSQGSSLDTHWVGCCVELRDGLGGLKWRNISWPTRIRVLDSSASGLVV